MYLHPVHTVPSVPDIFLSCTVLLLPRKVPASNTVYFFSQLKSQTFMLIFGQLIKRNWQDTKTKETILCRDFFPHSGENWSLEFLTPATNFVAVVNSLTLKILVAFVTFIVFLKQFFFSVADPWHFGADRIIFLLITFWSYIYIIFQGLKVIKKSQNSEELRFFYYFCLNIEGSGAGFIPPTIRIRIQEAQKHTGPTNPDPPHWFF